MAIAYLNEGATSLTAANWSDATGFGAAATLVINGGNQVISGELSQTASSIESLDIYSFGGVIGGASGALETDVDGTAESATSVLSRLRFWSPGTIFFKPNGGNTLAHFVQLATGTMYITGGITKNLHMESGFLSTADACTGTGVWEFTGGTSQHDYHATNTIAEVRINGGAHNFKKKVTNYYIGSGSVTIDCRGLTITGLYVNGNANVTLISCGGVTNFEGRSGTVDLSKSQRAFTLGSSSCKVGPALSIVPNPIVTLGTKTTIGSGPKGVV